MRLSFDLSLSSILTMNKGGGVPANRGALMASLKFMTINGKYLTVEKANG